MTMSQLLKQTKKCCVKIIRKFSFHPNGSLSPTSSSGGGGGGGAGGISGSAMAGRSISLNNRATTKYVLHKNCTPTRCKVQPTSPERSAGGAAATSSWMSSDDSPARRRLDFSPKPEADIPATQNNYRVNRDGKNLQKKRTNISNNKNVNLRKCFRMRKGFKEELVDEEVNNSSSVVSSKLDKISKTLYHVAGGDRREGEGVYGENKIHSNNLASQTSEKSKISKPLFLSGKHKKYNQIETQFGAEDGVDFDDDEDDDDELVACEVDAIRAGNSYDGGRLQFELCQPLPEAERSPLPGGSGNNYEEIVFEKVKFDRNKRYLRNETSSPSTASNRSQSGFTVAPSADSILSISFECKPSHPLSQFAEATSKSDDFVDSWRNYNVNSRWNKVSKNPWELEASKADSPAVSPQHRSSWNPFIDSSPASDSPVHQPTTKAYPPPYQVRTDIWQNLNNKNYEIDSDVIWRTSNSSRRTSASTVETWIEDEVFDNSFNEELERRCATLKI
ncbi:uncharacterized protein LOC135704529 [Ochlerotatus camptorhynchus]|uniref:uncharacterized protein LOC135704529 n=1 Tax=Ochlerotatus camptorhynchus TaxID=644619 RepID=UPI0031DAAC13